MRRMKQGFTLIEMVVVVLIIGILASIGLPYYYRTIESSKASDAVSLGVLLSSAARMYLVDNPGGSLSCSPVDNTCILVTRNYVARRDWSISNRANTYSYSVSGSGTTTSVSVQHRPETTAYGTWGYNFDNNGVCTEVGGTSEIPTPICPRF